PMQEAEHLTNRVICQKQPGLYAVSYHPVGGKMEPDFIKRLYDTISAMEGVQIRLCPTQGMYIINLNRDELENVLELTKEDEGTLFERSTACIGADVCQVGIGKSQLLLLACMERLKKEHFANGVLPAIHISGCPSACAAHQTSALGFRGGKKPTPEGLQDAFALYDNGSEQIGEERFGEELGSMLEKDIPDFLVELGRAVSEADMVYEEFRKACPEQFMEIVKRYV
ncbi:MAG: nitrite/sulfite reductase, partial [Eubacterium sp.]|nr:nitrite/sulfite reductase [Eubacterium sp.]